MPIHSNKAETSAIVAMLNEHYAKGHPERRDVVFVLVVAEKVGEDVSITLHANTDDTSIITSLLVAGKLVHNEAISTNNPK